MRAVLDACVLYPTVLREILIGVAQAGLYQPLWSERILEEWARATVKLGPGAETVARGEVVALRRAWPRAAVPKTAEEDARLWLPDPGDRHVLATAIVGKAEVIVTFNLSDFPGRVLQQHGLRAEHPDPFLLNLYNSAPAAVAGAVEQVRATAERLSGAPQPVRGLLKRAGLPRLGKALERRG
ncbi:putative nucleic acid-binding protein [Albidovulum inexpectatum]|uniref:Putative nucleic acid-binding protein n=1 Tax=Albidovulum inexpectatum TaxID=196587 RepID=A0A2S5JJK5_9RHOB|nr:PIN domain-containing protein [Albidovulum inexpectatum]PPB81659.1 putative nucleic acid-binding protein [Albidovulum inexpectatum]